MSIASEITSMGENLKKDYQSIANLGADLTNVDKNIENIAELLDGVYDNLPKTEYQEGTEITLENCLKGKLDYDNGVVGIGQTEQDSTQGYNLLQTQSTQTIGNVTLTKNDDGTFDLVGNNTSSDIVEFLLDINDVSLIDFSQNYYTMVTNQTGFIIQIALYNGNTWISTPFGRTATESVLSRTTSSYITQTYNKIRYLIRVPANTNINLKNVFVMIYKGSYDSSKSFEPYTGGQASPNPSYPQEIKCVRGWNILNQDKLEYGTISQSDGTTISPSGDVLYLDDYIPIKPSSYYTFRSNRANYLVRLFYYDRNKNYISTETKSGTFQTISTAYYLRVQCGASVNDEFQLVEGNVNLPYLPYNTIEETISGKNLLDIYNTYQAGYSVTTKGITFTWNDDGSISISGTSTSENAYVDIYKSTTKLIGKPGERIVYCLLENTSNDVVCHIYDYADGTYKNNNAGTIIAGHTNLSNATGSLIRIIIPSNNVTVNVKVYPIIATGAYTWDNLPTYEPYITPQTYQLSLGDIELNAIGNYKDELIYDVENDKVYKNEKIGKYTFTGNENIALATSVGNMYAFRYDDLSNNYIGRDENQYLCTNYKQKLVADWDNEGIINVSTSVPYIYIFTTGDTASNVTTFKTWLANNKPLLYYRLETPTQTEITDTTLINQVKALYNAHSNNGTTIITSNGNSPMIIKVRGLKGE